jgi:hypothetical protein
MNMNHSFRYFWNLNVLSMLLLPFFSNLDEDRVSAKESDDADHDQVLERHEHVQLKPETVVETENSAETEMETDAGEGERHIRDVDSDLDPSDEHEEDGGDAEEGEGVRDDWRGTDFWFSELVMDFRLDASLAG